MDTPAAETGEDSSLDPVPSEGIAVEGGLDDGPVPGASEYKRQHEGRAAMDRWMLHQTLMTDLEAGEKQVEPPSVQPP